MNQLENPMVALDLRRALADAALARATADVDFLLANRAWLRDKANPVHREHMAAAIAVRDAADYEFARLVGLLADAIEYMEARRVRASAVHSGRTYRMFADDGEWTVQIDNGDEEHFDTEAQARAYMEQGGYRK